MTRPSNNNNSNESNMNMNKGNRVGRRKSQSSASAPGPSPEAIHSKKKIQELLNLLEIQNKSKAPGFSNVLGLSAERLEAKNFFWNNKTNALTFRYTVPSRLLLSKLDCTTTLSTYLSIVDDVVSWTLILSNLSSSSSKRRLFKNNKQFQYGGTTSAEWGPSAQLGLFPGTIVDITSRVNPNEIEMAIIAAKESGTSHPIVIEIELRDAETGSIISQMTQEKFLDLNSGTTTGKTKKIKDRILFGRCCGCKSSSNVLEAVCPVSLQISDMYETLDFITHTKASFIVSPKHANTGLGSSSSSSSRDKKGDNLVHNGCQSILLEFMGRQVGQHILACPMAYLDQIEINFLLPLKASTKIMLEAFPLTKKSRYMSMRIIITTLDGGIVTEGLLQFTDTMQALGKQQQQSLYIGNTTTTTTTTPHHHHHHLQQQRHGGKGVHHPQRLYASTPTIQNTAEQLANQAIPEFPPPGGNHRNNPGGRHSNFTAPAILVRPPTSTGSSSINRPSTTGGSSSSRRRRHASSRSPITTTNNSTVLTTTPGGSDGFDHQPRYANPSMMVNRMGNNNNNSSNNNNNRPILGGRLPDEDDENDDQVVHYPRRASPLHHHENEDDNNNNVLPLQDSGSRRNYHHCGFDGSIDSRRRYQQQQQQQDVVMLHPPGGGDAAPPASRPINRQHPVVERKISNASSMYSRTSFDMLPPPVGYHHELEETIPSRSQQQPPNVAGRHRGRGRFNQHHPHDDTIDDDPRPGFPSLPERKISSIHSREGLLSSTSAHSRTSTINTADFPNNPTTRQISGGIGSQKTPPPRLVTAGLINGIGGGGSRNKQQNLHQPKQQQYGGYVVGDIAAIGMSSPAVAMGIPCSSVKESSSSSTTTSPQSPTKPIPVLGFGKSVGSGSSSGSRGYTMPQEKIPPRT